VSEFAVKDIDSCRKAWKRIEANEVESKVLRSQCKAFIKQCDAEVKIDEEAVLDIYPSSSRTYFTNATVTALLKKGVTIQKILHYANLTDSSMTELMESEKVVFTQEELNEISKEKVTNKFDALTPKEISDGEFMQSPKQQAQPSAQ
jgi:ribosomal protein S20